MKIENRTGTIINPSQNIALRKQRMSEEKSPSFAENIEKYSDIQGGQKKEKPETSEKLDFTKMTANKLYESIGQLIRSGQVDLDESTGLVGMMYPSSPLAKVNYDGLPAEYNDIPVNFFEIINEKIVGAISRNEQDTAASLKRASDTLSKFQGYENQKINKIA